jgi:TrmH family RNA methyltransferase
MHPAAPSISLRAYRQLHSRKERARTGMFLIEGIRQVATAVQAQIQIEALIFAPDLLRSGFGYQMVDDARARGIPCINATRKEFASLSQREHPQGLACVGRQQWAQFADLEACEGEGVAALYAPQDPGNVGTILRVCDAADYAAVILIGEAVDPYHPTALRAAMGATFSRLLIRCSISEFITWAGNQPRPIVGTSDRAAVDYAAYPFSLPFVLLMGSERQGLPPELELLTDTMVRIPMSGRVDSLNLAVATALVLYEARNQHRHGRERD